ncbi:MAG: hypothetical protein AAFN59_09080 [Pseudomonadota bacterium]
MTALSEYTRLEATAIWLPGAGQKRRDVIVSLGEATLTICDLNDAPLAHWSLAALEKKAAAGPAIFSPGSGSDEGLEISDPEMVAAIARIQAALSRGQPTPGRLRLWIRLGALLAALLVGGVWLPDALARYTAKLVPEATRSAIARDVMAQIEPIAGQPCARPSGRRALAGMAARLFEPGTQIVVMPAGLATTAHLSDGTILVGRALVEDFDGPEVLAGHLLAEDVRRQDSDPLLRLLQSSGLGASLGLVTSGAVSPSRLAIHAERLMAQTPRPVAQPALLEAFHQAGVPSTAYAYAQDVTGESTLAFIEADADRAEITPLLSDGDWLALQSICEG